METKELQLPLTSAKQRPTAAMPTTTDTQAQHNVNELPTAALESVSTRPDAVEPTVEALADKEQLPSQITETDNQVSVEFRQIQAELRSKKKFQSSIGKRTGTTSLVPDRPVTSGQVSDSQLTKVEDELSAEDYRKGLHYPVTAKASFLSGRCLG